MSYKNKLRCTMCDAFFYDISDLVAHLEKEHGDCIPNDFTPWQFAYYIKTGKSAGSCVVCKRETTWNETTHKYNRFCGRQECKDKYVDLFKNRMINRYGKATLLNDPNHQKKMLANRSISGTYIWSNTGEKIPYTGSYELSFLEFIDKTLMFPASDVIAPSPHTFYYEYEGKKHFYIPDFYIPSLNLEVEIKDGGDNPNMHHKIQEVDKEKEKLKDAVMKANNKNFGYVKIVNKNNMKMFDVLMEMKEIAFSDKPDRNIFMI